MVEIKQYDSYRFITDTLIFDGNPINLTGATVSLRIKNKRTLLSVKRLAEIVAADAGKVEYEAIPEDVAESGDFDLEWEIIFPDMKQLTIPNSGYVLMRIHPALV